MAKRKSRYDLEGIGKADYVPMQAWEYDKINGALKPLDAIARDMEARWGAGRLQELVSLETSSKFEVAKAKLDVAIHNNDVERVVSRAAVLVRGWQALDKEAQERGHKPAPPDIWIANAPAEDRKEALSIAIAKDNSDATLAQTDITVYTLVEIARIVRAWKSQNSVATVKDLFPGSVVKRIDGDAFEDEIPF